MPDTAVLPKWNAGHEVELLVQRGKAYTWLDRSCMQKMQHKLYPPLLPSAIWGPISHFFGASWPCVPAAWLAALLIKVGDVKSNPGDTLGFVDVAELLVKWSDSMAAEQTTRQ